MAKVFISYSRKDVDFAKQLTEELQKSNNDFWIDWEGIPPTVDWWKEIEKGIEDSDAFLFLISPDSARSKICGQEIDYAVKNGKRLLPIVVRETDGNEIHSKLKPLNWIFFRETDDFDASTTKLLDSIHTDYDWVQAHRRLQVKALEWERNHKENSFLLRGKDLVNAESQLATNSSKEPYPTDLQREYVFESRKNEGLQKQLTRRRRNIISIVGVISLIAVALGVTGQLNRFIYRPVDMENYWVTVPAGEFQMGPDIDDIYKQIIYSINVNAFEIGRYEVTNRQYLQCIQAGACTKPRNQLFNIEAFALHPVTDISWIEAQEYCAWIGGRLPTEAEWEKAASWNPETKTKTIYPWGNIIDCSFANFGDDGNGNQCVNNYTDIGSYAKGRSFYGVYDMAGNVAEWTNSLEAPYPYNSNDGRERPIGIFGEWRIVRGGSWVFSTAEVRSTARNSEDPSSTHYYIGFRCARDIP